MRIDSRHRRMSGVSAPAELWWSLGSYGLTRAASPMPGAPGISAAALQDAGAIFVLPDLFDAPLG